MIILIQIKRSLRYENDGEQVLQISTTDLVRFLPIVFKKSWPNWVLAVDASWHKDGYFYVAILERFHFLV